MAIVKTGTHRYESFVAFAEESTFQTAITDGSNFTKFDIVDGDAPSFNPDQFTDYEQRNSGVNMADLEDYYMTENGLWQRYTIPSFIAPADVLAHMVYAATQTVSEAVGDPFLKTYSMQGATDPDFSSDAGYFFTLLIKSPFASFSQKLTSCILESLTITFSPENGGRCMATGTAITGSGYTGTSNPSGTNSFSTVGIPSFHDTTAATLTVNSLDLVWNSFSITITNNLGYLGYSSGNAQNYKIISQKVTATANVKYDSNSDVFLNNKGTDINALVFTIGQNSADPHFNVSTTDTWLTNVTANRGDDNTVQSLDLSMDLLIDVSATNYVVFLVADGVDQTW